MTEPTDTTIDTEIQPEEVEDAQETPETFPAEYVRQLRQEAAEARVRAKRADTLARELFHSRVAALSRLADPDDLQFDENLLDDHAALEAAVEELISRKPHLASRQLRGDVGQGISGGAATVDLAEMLRRNA